MKIVIPIMAFAISFFISFLLGYVVIPFMHKLKFGQTILDIGPKWHKNKQGTATMGGIMFIVSTIVAIIASIAVAYAIKDEAILSALTSNKQLVYLLAGVLLALSMGFVGFMDDYIKVVKKRNLGLTAKQKTVMQLALSCAYLYSLYLGGMRYTRFPFFDVIDISSGFGLLFWPIALVFIYGFTNSVNLTDGVDGLATSVTAVVVAFLALIAFLNPGFTLQFITALALLGGLIGFLIWNKHPAKVFMGDTGSMFLGGMVVALSFAIEMPILLFLMGILYFAEAMSVVIQVAYYKRTKKRLFKMSPIHHHFELSGWSENKIVVVFSLVALLGCVAATALFLFT